MSMLRIFAALVLGVLAGAPLAQEAFPSRPIRIVVTFPAGGGPDIMARVVANKLTETLKNSVIVENRAGATGLIGAEHVAKSAPDGYTLVVSTPAPFSVAGGAGRKIGYDPVKDFSGVTMGVFLTPILVVAPTAPYKSVADLIAAAKTRGDKMNFGSAGIGNSQHLAGELFNQMAGINVLHVPYQGTAVGLVAVMNGQTDYYFSDPSAVPHIRSGKLRALAVSTLKRSSQMPDVPTVHESGLPNYEYSNWYGFHVPAKTPRAIVQRLNREIHAALKAQDTAERLLTGGMEPAPSTSEELDAFLVKDLEKWGRVVKAANIKFE
jgi:tripartite-type tricarboxylate transporter receptor subunit TctC